MNNNFGEYVVLHDGNVVARGDCAFCWKVAEKIVVDLNLGIDDYIRYERQGEGYNAFAYYDDGGRIVQIVIKKASEI